MRDQPVCYYNPSKLLTAVQPFIQLLSLSHSYSVLYFCFSDIFSAFHGKIYVTLKTCSTVSIRAPLSFASHLTSEKLERNICRTEKPRGSICRLIDIIILQSLRKIMIFNKDKGTEHLTRISQEKTQEHQRKYVNIKLD